MVSWPRIALNIIAFKQVIYTMHREALGNKNS